MSRFAKKPNAENTPYNSQIEEHKLHLSSSIFRNIYVIIDNVDLQELGIASPLNKRHFVTAFILSVLETNLKPILRSFVDQNPNNKPPEWFNIPTVIRNRARKYKYVVKGTYTTARDDKGVADFYHPIIKDVKDCLLYILHTVDEFYPSQSAQEDYDKIMRLKQVILKNVEMSWFKKNAQRTVYYILSRMLYIELLKNGGEENNEEWISRQLKQFLQVFWNNAKQEWEFSSERFERLRTVAAARSLVRLGSRRFIGSGLKF